MCQLLRKTTHLFTQACRTCCLNKSLYKVDRKYGLLSSSDRTNVPSVRCISHFSSNITDISELKWKRTFGSQSLYTHIAATRWMSSNRFYSIEKPPASTNRTLKSSRTKQPSRSNLPLPSETEVCNHHCMSSKRCKTHFIYMIPACYDISLHLHFGESSNSYLQSYNWYLWSFHGHMVLPWSLSPTWLLFFIYNQNPI